MTLAIGIDIGGTKLVGGVVDEQGAVFATARRESPASDPDAIERAVEQVVSELTESHEVVAVGVGAAGFIDSDQSRVLFAPNLAWRNEPLKADLEPRLHLPVVVENDANAAAWGEYRFGRHRDAVDLILVTVGTGIGGGIVMNGELHRGAFGIAAEFGHMRAVPSGIPCGCGNRGCWEQYASGSALVRNAREAAIQSTDGAGILDSVGGDVTSITGPSIMEAALRGDPFAAAQFAEVGRWLGEGLASLAAVFDPGVIVIGGGVSEAGDLLLSSARAAFTTHLTGSSHRPHAEIRQAALGNAAGMIGAADLARAGMMGARAS